MSVQRAVSTVQQHKQQFEGAEIDNEDLRHPANNQMTVGYGKSAYYHVSSLCIEKLIVIISLFISIMNIQLHVL
ncbi:ATP-dependent helicase [Dirofilaria immitis]